LELWGWSSQQRVWGEDKAPKMGVAKDPKIGL